MKHTYSEILLAVRYCHFEFWDSVPWSMRGEIAVIVRIVFNGLIDPDSTYSPQQLLCNAADEYKDAVVAALLELEMSDL